MMTVEAIVLRGDEGIYKMRRQFLELDDAAFLSVCIPEARYQFGRKCRFRQFSETCFDDPIEIAPLKGEKHWLPDQRLDRNPAARKSVCTFTRVIRTLRFIAGSLEPRYHRVRTESLPRIDRKRSGIKAGRALKDFAAETTIDHPRIVLVIVKRDAGENDESEEEYGQQDLKDRLA